jgi:hypothetical protein
MMDSVSGNVLSMALMSALPIALFSGLVLAIAIASLLGANPPMP